MIFPVCVIGTLCPVAVVVSVPVVGLILAWGLAVYWVGAGIYDEVLRTFALVV